MKIGRSRPSTILTVLATSWALIVGGCSNSNSADLSTIAGTSPLPADAAPTTDEGSILIGVVAGLTGFEASFSEPWEAGLQLAI